VIELEIDPADLFVFFSRFQHCLRRGYYSVTEDQMFASIILWFRGIPGK